jgi:epoxyqueuosine reductase
MDKRELTESVRHKAHALGFQQIGFSKVQPLNQEAKNLEAWLTKGYHGTMGWMEEHFDKRINPSLLVEGAKSLISVTLQYHQSEEPISSPLKIASYALGDDYHLVVRDKLHNLFQHISTLVGEIQGRVFCDSAPVMDKVWAAKSGLGWIGKNGNLLNKHLGSWFFIGEIILDLEFIYDGPTTDHCGSCTRCIDACPTMAIVAPEVIDATKCISYLTIEYKDQLPTEYKNQMGAWIFGCDICQQVCPWNRKAPLNQEASLLPRKEILEMTMEGWKALDPETFQKLFKKSSVKRTKYPGIVRNIQNAVENIEKSSFSKPKSEL